MELLTRIERDTSSQWFIDELATAARNVSERPLQAALVERGAPQGAMPPLHSRNEAEAYRVLEGEVTFFIDDQVVPAGPGDVVVAAAGTCRTFHVESEDARWLVVTRVSSLERFVEWGRAVAIPNAVPLTSWPLVDEEFALTSMGAANGIELLGPPGELPGGCQHV